MPDTAPAETPTPDTAAAPTPDAAVPVSDSNAAAPALSDAAAPSSAAAPAVPETYDLKLPEGTPLDAAALERTAAVARSLGLSDDAKAQSVVDFVASEVKASTDAVLAAHQPGGTAWTQMVDGWKTDALADPSLGKTPEERTATINKGVQVIQQYAKANPKGGEALTQFLEASGLGNHPATVGFFAWLGTAASEAAPVQPGASGATTEAWRTQMYPSMSQ